MAKKDELIHDKNRELAEAEQLKQEVKVYVVTLQLYTISRP